MTAVRRVGRRMGMSEGTGPDDDPFLRAVRAESRKEGLVQGRAEGVVQGRAEGVVQGRAEGVVQGRLEEARLLIGGTLEGRGVPVTAAVDAWLAGLGPSADRTGPIAAAVRCSDAEDFLRRVEALPSVPDAAP